MRKTFLQEESHIFFLVENQEVHGLEKYLFMSFQKMEKIGRLEDWNVGMLECWNDGMME